MTRSDVTLCSWNSPAPLAGNTRLYLSRSMSSKQSGWRQNFWTDAGACVHRTNTCPPHQPLWPATWSSASGTRTTNHQQSSWSMEKAVPCKHEGKVTSHWTSNWNQLFFQSKHTTQPALFRAISVQIPKKRRCFASFPSQLLKSK